MSLGSAVGIWCSVEMLFYRRDAEREFAMNKERNDLFRALKVISHTHTSKVDLTLSITRPQASGCMFPRKKKKGKKGCFWSRSYLELNIRLLLHTDHAERWGIFLFWHLQWQGKLPSGKMILQVLPEIKPHVCGSSQRNENLDILGFVQSESVLFIQEQTALNANR